MAPRAFTQNWRGGLLHKKAKVPDVGLDKRALITAGRDVAIANLQPSLTGYSYGNIAQILQSAGLRPTRQRMTLGVLLFSKGPRHLTAEMLYEEATLAKRFVSLATVYNTLKRLTDAGLLRQVCVDGAKTYFDSNVISHHHFYLENKHELMDIAHSNLVLEKMPNPPEGYEISSVDIVIRLRKAR
jgi:Fur family iron response transcriptional regulator